MPNLGRVYTIKPSCFLAQRQIAQALKLQKTWFLRAISVRS